MAKCQWIRVMADSEGLWRSDGTAMMLSDLPVSEALKDRLKAWGDCYYENERLPESERMKFDLVAFAAEGLAIAKSIKTELPDWTVIYFDESRLIYEKEQERSEFEYEINGAPD